MHFPNTKAGCRRLAALLIKQDPQRTVFEATGPYHRELETALANAGLVYAKANPRKVRRFADVIGVHAKTDSVDAKLLARFAAMVEIAPTTQKSASLQTLGELMNARKSLVADRTAIKNRSHVQTAKLLIRQNEARLKLIESQIKAIDHEAMKLIDSDTALSARFKILVSIPGISSLTACVMLTEMPELGTLDQRQVAGLAPHARESGNGRASVSSAADAEICARQLVTLRGTVTRVARDSIPSSDAQMTENDPTQLAKSNTNLTQMARPKTSSTP